MFDPTPRGMTLAEAKQDAFWGQDPDEICGSYELRINDKAQIGGIVETDDGTKWTGHVDQIRDEWADIKFENDNRPNLEWA